MPGGARRCQAVWLAYMEVDWRTVWTCAACSYSPMAWSQITSISLAVGAIDHGDPVLLVSLIVALSAAASVVDQAARTATMPRFVFRRVLASASSLTGSAQPQ